MNDQLLKYMQRLQDIIVRSKDDYLQRKNRFGIRLYVLGEDIPAGTLMIPDLKVPDILDGKTPTTSSNPFALPICFIQHKNKPIQIRVIDWDIARLWSMLDQYEHPDPFPLPYLLHLREKSHRTTFAQLGIKGIPIK